MESELVIERVRRIASVRADTSSGADTLTEALRASSDVKSWLAAADAELTRRLRPMVSFPEKAIADCTRSSLHDAVRANERADTLTAVPSFADALNSATITPGHIDTITKHTKGLDTDQRAELLARAETLVDVASLATVAQFAKRLDLEVRAILRDDALARLERQRRATTTHTWIDAEGMWCLSGRFDPLTGVSLAARLDAEVQALFAENTPDTCPTDPIDKQRHLTALALARLITGTATTTPGRPDYVVVIDTTQPDGTGGPLIDWGIPVEIPTRVLADLVGNSNVHTVVVRNGVVLYAPGQLDLGRTTRLANRAQRRALRALYSTCAVPGCTVTFDRCKIHHIEWWRNGGLTDLSNLLPVCVRHHTNIHTDEWQITLGDHRELHIRLPDGNVLSTGPPTRAAA